MKWGGFKGYGGWGEEIWGDEEKVKVEVGVGLEGKGRGKV